MRLVVPDVALAVLVQVLARVAPEADLASAGDDDDLADALGLDSTDVLNVLEAVRDATGVAIPERDLPLIRTRRRFVDYLAAASQTTTSG